MSIEVPSRRNFLALCGALGLKQTLFPGALLALSLKDENAQLGNSGSMDQHEVTAEAIQKAALIAGIQITPAQVAMLLDGLRVHRDLTFEIRKLHLPCEVAPATIFQPAPGSMTVKTANAPLQISKAHTPPTLIRAASAASSAQIDRSNEEEIAFASVRELAELVRTRKVAAVDLTRLYLARLHRYNPQLFFMITSLEKRALEQASAADREIASGKYRGPLHGIPWGAKDLFSVSGYPTTWGAGGFEKQQFESDATVVARLDQAGAILIAKLSMGELAQGDVWFGGKTRNPWNPRQGSGGSSAGSASATSAGCVAFALGTETMGSLTTPSARCGVTGYRPTFGFVPRTGAMPLSWSMDKVGVIARSVEDCALVMDAIHGPDHQDLTVQEAAFNWDANYPWKQLRVGFLRSNFPGFDSTKSEKKTQDDELTFAIAALEKLKAMGVQLIPVELPQLNFTTMLNILSAEAAASFDDLTLSGRDAQLVRQDAGGWPNGLRIARFLPAVDYIQAQRVRTVLIRDMAKMFETVDIIVALPGGQQLIATNLSGHPAVAVPSGLRSPTSSNSVNDETGGPGTPTSVTFLGALYADDRLLAFARAYQERTNVHYNRPTIS